MYALFKEFMRNFSLFQWLFAHNFVKSLFYHKALVGQKWILTMQIIRLNLLKNYPEKEKTISKNEYYFYGVFFYRVQWVLPTDHGNFSFCILKQIGFQNNVKSWWGTYHLRDTVFLYGRQSDPHVKIISFFSLNIHAYLTWTTVMEKIRYTIFLAFMSHPKKSSECLIKPPERKLKICLEKLFFQLVENLLVQVSVAWHCRDQKYK